MDKEQLHNEFMSIISESHPGLTFEEYRDSCVFLILYHFLCLKYGEKLEDQYKLNAMVRLAVRGKLQMPVFIRFIEQASSFIHLAGSQIQLTGCLFYKKILTVHQIEKQKSYARFFRKLIKKIDAWDSDELLFSVYGDFFGDLLTEFARAKKETYVSQDLLALFKMFFDNSGTRIRKAFLPDFQYGILFNPMLHDSLEPDLSGYEDREVYVEVLRFLCYMKGIPLDSIHLYSKKDWMGRQDCQGSFDAVAIFMPEGAEPGTFVSSIPDWDPLARFMNSGTKGELPLILSALPLLNERGAMAVAIPGALLYREGKEAQIRRYLIEEAGCLDVVMLLPDHMFHSTGQNEVMLFFRNHRDHEEVMFFDCSQVDSFDEEKMDLITKSWKNRESISGFCTCADKARIRENDYNLNLPRYITRMMKMTEVDLQKKLARISQIEEELKEIDHKIAMYRRDLELNLLL